MVIFDMLVLGQMLGRMRFLPFGVRDRILRLFFPPQSRRNHPFIARVGNAQYAGNLDNYLDWTIFFFGLYERGLLMLMQSLVARMGRQTVYWDVGANSGQHALFVAGLGARVEAFEPFEPVRRKLERSIALNPTLSVRVHPFGLGDTDCELSFVPPDNENLGTGHFGPDGGLTLPIRRGDAVPAEPPTLIKIDAEGFEDGVLRGLADTIARARPVLLCEFSERTREHCSDLRPSLPPDYLSYDVEGAERPRMVAYSGAGQGEMILFVPRERARLLDGLI